MNIIEKIKDWRMPYPYRKYYEWIRWDIWRFFQNIWLFRRQLVNYYQFDYSGSLWLFSRGIELTAKHIKERGMEEDSSRLKRVEKMERAVHLLNLFAKRDYFFEEAEEELGLKMISNWTYKPTEEIYEPTGEQLVEVISDVSEEQEEINGKIVERSHEINARYWNELWQIIKGQDFQDWNYNEETRKKYNNDFDKWFDGSGINGWWD